jgi:hypothetical protein
MNGKRHLLYLFDFLQVIQGAQLLNIPLALFYSLKVFLGEHNRIKAVFAKV